MAVSLMSARPEPPSIIIEPQKSLENMPTEVLLNIVEFITELEAVKCMALTSRLLFCKLTACQNIISGIVLKKQLSHVYKHAITSYCLLEEENVIPCFDNIGADDVAACITKARRITDKSVNIRLTFRSATRIARTFKMVEDICNHFLQDCSYSKDGQNFLPMWDSVRYRPPIWSEIVRIQRAIYLFQILASICQRLRFTAPPNRLNFVQWYAHIENIQKQIAETLLAPWEFHQVLAMQAYFRRALHGFEKGKYVSERIIPDLLVMGIEFVHKALCVVDRQDLSAFLTPYEDRALDKVNHALGIILSRGTGTTWTRKEPRQYEDYTPFADDDIYGYLSWVNLEKCQLRFYGQDPVWDDFFWYEQRLMEGRLDIWGAALWSVSRWEEIQETLSAQEPLCWQNLKIHWDSLAIGFRILGAPALWQDELAEYKHIG